MVLLLQLETVLRLVGLDAAVGCRRRRRRRHAGGRRRAVGEHNDGRGHRLSMAVMSRRRLIERAVRRVDAAQVAGNGGRVMRSMIVGVVVMAAVVVVVVVVGVEGGRALLLNVVAQSDEHLLLARLLDDVVSERDDDEQRHEQTHDEQDHEQLVRIVVLVRVVRAEKVMMDVDVHAQVHVADARLASICVHIVAVATFCRIDQRTLCLITHTHTHERKINTKSTIKIKLGKTLV